MKSLTFVVVFISLAFLILAGCTVRNNSLEVEEGSYIFREHYIYYPIVDDNVKALFNKASVWISNNEDKEVLSIQIVNADLSKSFLLARTKPSGIVIFYK